MPREDNPSYDLGFERIRSFILEHKPSRILLQIADGLKFLAETIVDYIESISPYVEVYLSGSPTYGSCDIPVDEARALGIDAIVHVGHNSYPYMGYHVDTPVLYIEAYYTGEVGDKLIEILLNSLREYREQDIVLLASIQYIRQLNKLYKTLLRQGYRVIVPDINPEPLEPGQVLGCIYDTVRGTSSNTYVVLSSGLFHGLGVCLSKPGAKVLIADIHRDQVIDLESECRKVLAKRYYIVSKLINNPFNTATIIVGSRPGQYRPWLVKTLYRELVSREASVYKAIVSYLDRDRLAAIDKAFNTDVYIVTSCPRLPIDDLSDYHKPVITPGEAFMVISGSMKYRYPW